MTEDSHNIIVTDFVEFITDRGIWFGFMGFGRQFFKLGRETSGNAKISLDGLGADSPSPSGRFSNSAATC